MATHAPPHKQVPGTAFLVDGFRFASHSVSAYFLTHGHSDHYTGLREDWAGPAPLYCSPITSRVVQALLGVRHDFLRPLPLNTPTLVEEGVEVTLVDANHCPGAVQLLFHLPDGRRYIHTGDMRFHPSMVEDEHLAGFRGADALFLDTTYASPRYSFFPPQERSVEYVASTLQGLMLGERGQLGQSAAPAAPGLLEDAAPAVRRGHEAALASPAEAPALLAASASAVLAAAAAAGVVAAAAAARHRCLYLISTYLIGKERILAAVAATCGCRIAVTPRKLALLRCLDLPGLDVDRVFTTNAASTPVRVVEWGFLGETWPFFRPNFVNMEALRAAEGAEEVVGVVPTGWLHEAKKAANGFPVRRKGACTIHLVPYSEHSSFTELREYVKWLRPHQVVPTVGVGGENGELQATKIQKHFRDLVDEQASKAKFLAGFYRAAHTQSGLPASAAAGVPGALSGAEGAGGGGWQQAGQHGGQQASGAEDCGGSDMGGEAGGGGGGDDWPEGQEQQAPEEEAGTQEEEEEEEEDDEEEANEQQQQQHHRLFGAEGPEQWPAPGPAAAAAGPGGRRDVGGAGASSGGVGIADDPATLAALAQLQAVLGPAGAGGGGGSPAGGAIDLTLKEESAAAGALTQAELRQLLTAAGGSVERAVNWYLDGTWKASARGSISQQQWQGRREQRPGAQGMAAAPAATPAKDGGKRKGGGSGGGSGSAVKKPRKGAARPPGQRSIMSFFGSGGGGGGGAVTIAGPAASQTQAPAAVAAAAAAAAAASAAMMQPRALAAKAPAGLEEAEASHRSRDSTPASQQQQQQQHSGSPAAPPRSLGTPLGHPDAAVPGPSASPPPRDAVALPLAQYDPVGHACWRAGEPMPYLHIARAFEAAESTTKRLRIGDVFCNMFRSVLALSPDELVQVAYLTTGKIAPDYKGQELNVGGATVAAAVTEATGVGRARLRELYNEAGDFGDVAQAYKRTQSLLVAHAPLTVRGVFAALQRLAAEQGQGAKERRQRGVLGLLWAARECETRYLVRTLVQALRVGANWRTVIPALARAVLLHREAPPALSAAIEDAGGVGSAGSPTSPAGRRAAPLPSKAQLDAAGAAAAAAFHVCPNLELLIKAMLEHPLSELGEHISPTPGVPIKPMLAKAGAGPADVLRQLKGQPFLAELKYDGMRAQIHLMEGGKVRIFSRNCEDRTASHPDVAAQVLEAAAGGATSAIFDAEVAAVDRFDGSIRAFQDLATRARAGVEASSISVPVCVFAFDLLYLDGRSLLAEPLARRRAALAAALPAAAPGRVELARGWEVPTGALAGGEGGGQGEAMDVEEQQEAQQEGQQRGARAERAQRRARRAGQQQEVAAAAEAAAAGELDRAQEGQQAQQEAQRHEETEQAQEEQEGGLETWLHERLLEAFAAGGEGLMLKSLGGAYQPSKRSEQWVKLKRDYVEGLADSLDVVVIGAWYGSGRKAGWFSPYLLAVYDPASEELQSLCRCMSGFSDAFYREARERLGEAVIPGPRPYYRTSEQPDVWFDAREVWEIRGADLTISPVHQAAAGMVHPERGAGLRFPRFLRIREDKAIEDATTAEQVAEMYSRQTRKAVRGGAGRAGAAGAAPQQEQQQQQQPQAAASEEAGRDGSESGGEVEASAGSSAARQPPPRVEF